MNITSKDVDLLAPNAAAAKNGRDLVSKKKFVKLCKSADDTVLFGECAGSGKTPYICSADYVDPAAPVFRCTCPSRQFPCKHGLGLISAYASNLVFTDADIPQDILDKRSKIEKKQENKEKSIAEAKEKKPAKVNPKAVIKKAETQLQGIEIAEKILRSMVQMGLSSIDAKNKRDFETQIKELGNYYINGIQAAFSDLLIEHGAVSNDQYTKVIAQINYIYALLKKSKDYLTTRKENPETPIELSSAIEEQIGYVWKLTELLERDLYEEQAEIIQLSFYSYDDAARRELVEEGYWMNLKSGKIYKTKNYRPYKAQKYIKEENSFFDVMQVKELYIYPGDVNPRVRWNEFITRELTPKDLAKVCSFGISNYAELVKTAKSTIKSPLMDKNPVFLIALHEVYLSDQHLVLKDADGNKLLLKDIAYFNHSVENTLKTILPSDLKGKYLLVMVENDIEQAVFSAQGLAILTTEKNFRLLY